MVLEWLKVLEHLPDSAGTPLFVGKLVSTVSHFKVQEKAAPCLKEYLVIDTPKKIKAKASGSYA